MLHSVNKISDLNTAINNYFIAFKDDIMISTAKHWNDEDNKGSSFASWNTMKYYTLMYLLIIVYQEIERTKKLNYSWSYYENKFNLIEYKKCLACFKIDIDKAYTAFGFDYLIEESGIGLQGISINNMVEYSNLPVSSTNIKELINLNICINNIN